MIRSFGYKVTERLRQRCASSGSWDRQRGWTGNRLGTSAQFWLNLQTHYDLDVAEDRAAEQIEAIEPLRGV